MSELIFNVTQESDGGFCAVAAGGSIFTQGDTWNELPLTEAISDMGRDVFIQQVKDLFTR